jgi:hypothetical protein
MNANRIKAENINGSMFEVNLSSEIEGSLCFEKIMTFEVLFFDKALSNDCKTFCEKRNITYLPCRKDEKVCYTLVNGRFQRASIEESQKADVKDYVFEPSVVKKFRKHHVLFVYRKSAIAGVVHFCDYNREPVSVYAYALLLEFETKLRELLISNGLNNRDMLYYFQKHRGDKIFCRKAQDFEKDKNQNKMREIEPFQMFDLRDLICLLKSEEIYQVPEAINDNLRNTIMHAKDVVKHKDFETSPLIYDFKSFCQFFQMIRLLKSESDKVSHQIQPNHFADEEVRRLRDAGLFVEL